MNADHDSIHDDPTEVASAAGAEFVQEFTLAQRRFFLYILSQIGNPIEAEEILQEANLVIWRKADRFQPGTNFFAWACRIATYEVLKFRDKRRRDKLRFSDTFVEVIAAEAGEATEHSESRRRALATCLGKLKPVDRELIQRRYSPGTNGMSLAEAIDRPINSVYQSLGRIRKALLDCIHRELAAETA